jgi:hypothetical protein
MKGFLKAHGKEERENKGDELVQNALGDFTSLSSPPFPSFN